MLRLCAVRVIDELSGRLQAHVHLRAGDVVVTQLRCHALRRVYRETSVLPVVLGADAVVQV